MVSYIAFSWTLKKNNCVKKMSQDILCPKPPTPYAFELKKLL